MTHQIRLREEATQDLTEAANWYERQVPGLGHDFLDTVLNFLDSISDNPLQYPIIHRQIRRALLPRFPFGIYYKVEEKFILVYRGDAWQSKSPAMAASHLRKKPAARQTSFLFDDPSKRISMKPEQ